LPLIESEGIRDGSDRRWIRMPPIAALERTDAFRGEPGPLGELLSRQARGFTEPPEMIAET
jgi:hypothetical protein